MDIGAAWSIAAKSHSRRFKANTIGLYNRSMRKKSKHEHSPSDTTLNYRTGPI